MSDKDDAVSIEYFTDTVNDYIRQGLSREEAIAKACDDGIKLIEERNDE